MNNLRTYQALWSGWLKGISLTATAILVGVPWLAMTRSPATHAAWFAAILCAAILAGCALLTIRGYAIGQREIQVKRLLWSTHIPLDGLRSVEADPAATQRSLRLFGNGGLFAFCGWFRNKKLGVYRMFVTDPKRAVVLRMDRRTMVLSPDDPVEFIRQLKLAAGMV